MRVNGRYGSFTVKPNQVSFYAKRAKAQQNATRRNYVNLLAWLEQHKNCANGCGKPVAFHDNIYYALMHGGCCSAECEIAHSRQQSTL